MISFFSYYKNNLILNKPEILLHPEFATILRKDRTSEGDADGRKKLYTFKVFGYIYLMYDFRSPYNELDYDARHKVVTKELDLFDDWKPNKLEKEAIEKYMTLQELASPSIRILGSVKRGLQVSAKVVDRIISKMEKAIDNLDTFEKNLDYEDIGQLQAMNAIVEGLKKDMFGLLPLPEKINEALVGIRKVEDNIKNDLAEQTDTAAGGKSIGNRADPL